MNEQNKMLELVNRLNELNYHYYTLDAPLVSDREYDVLYQKLVELEAETGVVLDNSPTKRVGGDVLEGFSKHIHISPLYSLDKAQSLSELSDWDRRNKQIISNYKLEHANEYVPEIEYVVELKFDGLTLNLTYDEGKLIQAATRGNGTVGEVIYEQVKTIKSIPLNIEYMGKLEVQGEAVMPLSRLNEYNAVHSDKLKNARNAAAGAIRNLDTKITAERKLDAYFYNVGYNDTPAYDNDIAMKDFLKQQKFKVSNNINKYKDIDKAIERIVEIGEFRHSLDILTDGAVIKINNYKLREILGYTQKFPRWAIAYKYEAEEVSTKLENVEWNIGRTGKLTPIAHLTPIEIGGVTVSRATLNNIDDIRRKNLRINDEVVIRRSNDVIPEILSSAFSGANSIDIIEPQHCPFCNSKLSKIGVNSFCINSLSCKPQILMSFVHFASRDAMNIVGLSEKTITKLLDLGVVVTLSDIFKINYNDVCGIEGYKDKKINNLLDAIKNAKNVDLANFIFALGIKNVGKKNAKEIAKRYKNLEKFLSAEYDDLILIDDVGDIIARSVVDFLADSNSISEIKKMVELGVVVKSEEMCNTNDSLFTNKSVVITGTIEGYSRNQIADYVEKHGGSIKSSVSNSVNLLICGDNPGSKYSKAVEKGIEIMYSDEIIKIMRSE